MEEVFIKKYWEEDDILFYLHFQHGEPVRQIEISREGKVFLTAENPVKGDKMLFDQDLDGLEVGPTDHITKSEFEEAWKQQKTN